MCEEQTFYLTAEQEQDPEICRETGKRYYFENAADEAIRQYGLKLLVRASARGDCEANYIIGALLAEGVLRSARGDSVEQGLALLCQAAAKGFLPARTRLNQYTEKRYRKDVAARMPQKSPEGPLCDFDGKIIKIKRTGALTPIDATLRYVDGKNVLTFEANVSFISEEDLPERFYDAVLDGMRAWQGEYEVFGGQKVYVEVKLTAKERLFDSVLVVPMTHDLRQSVGNVWRKIGTESAKRMIGNVVDSRRSFAGVGIRKWSVRSRKIIFIQSEDDRFADYDEIKAIAKHEFGHALGLGDLYECKEDALEGVPKGRYRELDSYLICDKTYNLVMCDHHGPISNNDIEMVVLAFSKNKFQRFQPDKRGKETSEALGKGN